MTEYVFGKNHAVFTGCSLFHIFATKLPTYRWKPQESSSREMQVSHPIQNSGTAGVIHQAVVEVVNNERQRFHSENRSEGKCLMEAFIG